MLQNEILQLRAIEPEDLEALYTIENDTELWNVSNIAVPYSKFALREYIAAQPADIFQTGQLRLAIEERKSKATVGFIDLFAHSPLSLRAEVGIALLKEFQQQGYASQALALLEEYAATHLHLRFLYAHVSQENNPNARALFQKAHYEEIALLPLWHHSKAAAGYENIVLFQKFL